MSRILNCAGVALVAAAIGLPGAPASASGFGYYFIDIASRTKEVACDDVKRVIAQMDTLTESRAECFWLTEGQRERSYVDDTMVTIQFREVHGAIYEMRYDLPKTTSQLALNAYLERDGVTKLEDVGVSRIGKNAAVNAAIDVRNKAQYQRLLKGKPCEWVRFTGFGFASVEDLRTLESSANRARLAAQSPLQCKTWLSRNQWGQDRSVQCNGIRFFTAAKARVMTQNDGVARVLTNLSFQDGTVWPVSLAIRSKDATCLKGDEARP
tara:strand:- start:2855 stop:3655 length:801 start_codon:yes stop_codon:yes gene_type:complete